MKTCIRQNKPVDRTLSFRSTTHGQPEISTLLQSYRNKTVQMAMHKQGVVQAFRLVKPEDIRYKHEDEAAMFATHQVMQGEGSGNIFGFNEAVLADGIAELPEVEAGETRIDPAMYEKLTNAMADLEGGEKEKWAAYFSKSGRTSLPQLAGDLMGQKPYYHKPGLWRLIVNLFQKQNALWSDSHFKTEPVLLNAKVPMLVSKKNKMAINALYAEPKEVYLSAGKLAKANNYLNNEKVELLSYSGNSVKVNEDGAEELLMCRPRYISQGQVGNLESAGTHICDAFVTHYQKMGEPMLNENFNRENTDVPWDFHRAMKMIKDGSDVVSLENGARNLWIQSRGNSINIRWRESADFLEEMNKTWYFRMYGPEEKGQDLKAQTEARFS